jgi:hypothetical protein
MLNLLGFILIIAAIFVGVRGQEASFRAPAGLVRLGHAASTLGGLVLAMAGMGLLMFG